MTDTARHIPDRLRSPLERRLTLRRPRDLL